MSFMGESTQNDRRTRYDSIESKQPRRYATITDQDTTVDDDVEFHAHPVEKCSECGRPTRDWYDNRNVHIRDEFKAGTLPSVLAKGYKLHPETIRKILIEELGTEAWWRINGVNRANYLKETSDDAAETDEG